MRKHNYYGLKNGQKLGYNIGREELYLYRIFSDGSECVEIKTKDGRRYIFGSIEYCRTSYKNGASFTNKDYKNYILLKDFKKALCA